MENTLTIENEIKIQAPIPVVWDALINPVKTTEYMYGCKVVSDFKVGSPMLWIGAADGVTYVKGSLIAITLNQELVYTVIDPNGTYEDIPSNYLIVRYELSEEGEDTILKVNQGDYNKVADGQKRYDDSMAQGGWQGVLEGIKKVAEAS